MKQTIACLLLLALLAGLAGCGGRLSPALPEDATAFALFDYVNPEDGEDEYLALEYQGRIYLPYGTQTGRFRASDLGPCLGYRVQDGEAQRDSRVCGLAADPQRNYLVELFPEAIMLPPYFYRALDTAGQDIEIPAYIEPLGYSVWE